MATLSISVTGTSSFAWDSFPEATVVLALVRAFLPLFGSSSSELLSLKPGGGAAMAGGGGCSFSPPPSASSSSSSSFPGGGGRAVRSTAPPSREAQVLEQCFPELPLLFIAGERPSALSLALQESQKYREVFWD